MISSKFLVALLVHLAFLRCSHSSYQHDNEESLHKKNKFKKKSTDRPPNIVLLFMDDLGYGDLGFTGHPTTHTPNIDSLAFQGKVLTSWYSGCAVCTGSRAALMTGRQFPRTGVSPVFGPTGRTGLPLNETTVAEQLKLAGYTTAIVGKWHLGQRIAYLPGNQGFDFYLGIPYSDDMGDGIASACPATDDDSSKKGDGAADGISSSSTGDDRHQQTIRYDPLLQYREQGLIDDKNNDLDANNQGDDPAGHYLPLVYQEHNKTRIVEQPLDFTKLAQRYNDFAVDFITKSAKKDEPFFLYLPFSHVHVTSPSQPEKQYAGCKWKKSTTRGAFGDALAEADWIIGNIMETLRKQNVEENTLVLFASDNGPWLYEGLSGGSAGLLTGRYAGYWSTGKGSTWEGGIRSPSFAYWKGTITPSRTSEVVSSLDVLPTLSSIAGVPIPTDRPIDGKDMSDILFHDKGKSKHEFLFIYNDTGITAVRHGPYKAHWYTAPGLGGFRNQSVWYPHYPLMFDVEKDPSESTPLCKPGTLPSNNSIHKDAMEAIMKAYAFERATFVFGKIIPEPNAPWEGPGAYGLCCDRSKKCNCANDNNNDSKQQKYNDIEGNLQSTTVQQEYLPSSNIGILDIGTKEHHDRYHSVMGEEEPSPPKTRAQLLLRNLG